MEPRSIRAMQTCVLKLTKASEKYGNLNIRPCGKEFFPADAFGSHSKKSGLGVPITLNVEGLPEPIKTDIPTGKTGRPRWLFRERKWLRDFLKSHNLARGDEVAIRRTGQRAYNLRPARFRQQLDFFEDTSTPVRYAHALAEEYIEATTAENRKDRGQYFTPPEVATFMAELGDMNDTATVRVLDPGAGTGILSCAACERLAQSRDIKTIELDVYEMDPCLTGMLEDVLSHLEAWLQQRGIRLQSNIVDKDFVVTASRIMASDELQPYDLIISNPPYKKINGDDPRSHLMAEAVCGQPNLYALFMFTASKLLKPSGTMVFITPRSYMAGCYFEAFRHAFFDVVHPVRVHLFDSRKDVFANQGVLQENVILKARKGPAPKTVVISHSQNAEDLGCPVLNKVPLSYALTGRGGMILRLPANDFDDMVVEIVDSWTATLSDYGLDISTGPVVPFRAKEHITCTYSRKDKLVPLLWMRNVQPMLVVWPCDSPGNRDANNQFIADSLETRKQRLLVPRANMVLLRRFSAKEQKRRLTAAPLLAQAFHFDFIGIENHLNYIRRPESELTPREAIGLAVLLNSRLLDQYFRICSGNTQVSATEIRAIPLPSLDTLIQLGKAFEECAAREPETAIDILVWETIKPPAVMKKLLKRVIN